jgi:hypothetical protein
MGPDRVLSPGEGNYYVILIAPESAPQICTPPLSGVQHPLAPEFVQGVSRHGNRPVGLWKVINGLASAHQPQGRDQRRCLCLRFWGAARELLRAKVLYRHDGMVATRDFAFAPKPRSQGRLSPGVGRSALSSILYARGKLIEAQRLNREREEICRKKGISDPTGSDSLGSGIDLPTVHATRRCHAAT